MSDIQPESKSYRSDATSGTRWGAVRSIALQVTSILTTAVLARILSDVDFGLVAVTVIVITMFDLITRVGFGASVIRRDDPSDRSNSTFFWASITLGLIAGALAALVARPAATLAGSVEAAPLIVLATATLPINLAAHTPSGLLAREFRYRTMAMIDMSSSFVHAVTAISLALVGFGAWAVVIGQVLRSLPFLAGSVLASGFRPRAMFDRAILRKELSFNAGFLGADFVTYTNKNADYWFVGNRLGTAQLGVYYVAYVLPTLLRRRVTAIGHDIMFPIVSRIKDDRARIASAYLRVVGLVSFIVVPVLLGLAVLADLAILIGFGSEWLDAIAPLRVFSVAAAVTSITVIANAIFPALGRPGVLVTVGLIALIALGIGLAFSFEEGTLTSISLAVLGAAVVGSVLTQFQVRSFLNVSFGAFFRAVAPFVIAAVVMAGAIWALRATLIGNAGPLAQALIAVPVGAGIYLLIGRVVFWASFQEQLAAMRALLSRGGSV